MDRRISSRIKGMDVVLYAKTQTGTDPFGRPEYSETPVTVHNVLVSPGAFDDMTSSLDLTGKKVLYTLGIPKGDANTWKDRFVEFFGQRFKVITVAEVGIEDNVPLLWHKKVLVERYE